MSKILREQKTMRAHEAKHPSADIPTPPDISTPPESQGEVLADILQMAEESGRRSMKKIRPRMERAIRAALKSSTD